MAQRTAESFTTTPREDGGGSAPEKQLHTSNEKVEQILQASRIRDYARLRELAAEEGGFVDDLTRRTAWPVLLACNSDETHPDAELVPHPDEAQVDLDVDRSFVYYPEDESEKRALKRNLAGIIKKVLRRHNMLHYFQGYHDIVQVLLLVLGEDAAFEAVRRLSLLRIRDFMLPSIAGTEIHLRLLPPILHALDAELYRHLSQTQPFFALAATLTLYAHEIEEYGEIARLFDFVLANEAAVPLYLFAVIVVSRKKELMKIDANEPELLQAVLSKLPKPLDLEGLIQRTSDVFKTHPPHKLSGRAWRQVSNYSVLKTTCKPEELAQQTPEHGECLFMQQDAEIKRREARALRHRQLGLLARRYRWPATYAGLVLFPVILAYGSTRLPATFWSPMLFHMRQQISHVFS
ncbi:RabGAP/TBC [Piedraia hortae CBS 480.64]|uniref:RabGAP/TBC n=1 Tax=Piedraia hortae CBS 480.64 TaxID=1314780 RepID=A0A6A7BYN9_9PEZI|nr:RabGAP/TBC [Piedraia hortae CBS 480.64]